MNKDTLNTENKIRIYDIMKKSGKVVSNLLHSNGDPMDFIGKSVHSIFSKNSKI